MGEVTSEIDGTRLEDLVDMEYVPQAKEYGQKIESLLGGEEYWEDSPFLFDVHDESTNNDFLLKIYRENKTDKGMGLRAYCIFVILKNPDHGETRPIAIDLWKDSQNGLWYFDKSMIKTFENPRTVSLHSDNFQLLEQLMDFALKHQRALPGSELPSLSKFKMNDWKIFFKKNPNRPK